MDSACGSLTGPAETWWNRGVSSYDGGSFDADTKPSASTLSSKSSSGGLGWWSLLINDNPSDECDDDEEKLRQQWQEWKRQNSSILERSTSKVGQKGHEHEEIRQSDSQLSRMERLTKKKKRRQRESTPTKQRTQVKDKQTWDKRYERDNSQSRFLNQMLPDSICRASEPAHPNAVQRLERQLLDRLKDIENPVMWKLLDLDGEDLSSTESSVPSPNSASIRSSALELQTVMSPEDIFSELRREIPALQARDSIHSLPSKYKALLRPEDHSRAGTPTVPKPQIGLSFFHDDVKKDDVPEGRIDENHVPLVPEDRSVQIPGLDSRPIKCIEIDETKPIASALSEDSGTKVIRDELEPMIIHPMLQFSPSSKSCMAPLFKNLGVLKKKKPSIPNATTSMSSVSQKSTSESHPVIRVSRTPSSSPKDHYEHMCYIYDYHCTNHSYVAYFQRGLPPKECLRMYELPTPDVFPTLESEVVVKIEVSTVSGADCCIRRGDWWGEHSSQPLSVPIVPGTAFTGQIKQLDSSGSRSGLKKGDRVVSLVRIGANSRHLCIGYDRLVKVPASIRDPALVACVPEIYLTAFQTLHIGQRNAARYRKTSLAGKSILILGGGSTLGRALLEVAVAAGSSAAFATGKAKDFSKIRDVGGMPLSKAPHHWLSLLKEKIDIVVGADEPYTKPEFRYDHMQTLNKNGRLILVTAPGQPDTTADLDDFNAFGLGTNRKLHHYNVYEAWENEMKECKRDLTHLMKLLEEGLIAPKIVERIPLNKVAKAQELLESQRINGFIVCEPWIKGKKKELASSHPTRSRLFQAATSGSTEGSLLQNSTDTSKTLNPLSERGR